LVCDLFLTASKTGTLMTIRLRADLQKPLASRGASTDEYTP
jgi:hypothetical protein